MSILALNATQVNADTSPVAPAAIPDDTPDQSANPYEFWGTQSDVGELGYLFDHDPFEWVPTPLEGTSPAADVTVSPEAFATVGPTLVDTTRPQNNPNTQVEVAASTPSGAWRFSDTLRKEVATFQGRVQQLVNRPGQSGFNNGGQ